jgi:hypothetical protein
MLILTEEAALVCMHEVGRIQNKTSQDFVTIEKRRILVENDPEGRSISGCPVVPPIGRPCVTTLKVQTGYSDWIRIGGRSICLDTITGFTDGTPPGVVKYKVNFAGQNFVSER